jgi:hypothetical protein
MLQVSDSNDQSRAQWVRQYIRVMNLFSSLVSRMRARMPAATTVHLRSEQQVAGFTPLLSTPTLIGGALFSSRSLFESSCLVMQASDGHDKKTNNGLCRPSSS